MKVNKKFIEKINKGDRDAEKELFDYTKSKIKAFLEVKYPKNNTTEDDTSDIVIKIFEKINKFNIKKSKYHTWIVNVAKNHMIDKSRLYSSNVMFCSTSGNVTTDSLNFTSADGNLTSYTLTSSNNFLGEYEDKDDVKALSSCVGTSDFSLINMKYCGGYNYKEIGDEVNMDKTQVSNRVNYIKKKLKRGD